MATPNKPEWIYAEALRDPSSLDMRLRVAIRADYGWVKVLDIVNDGWTQVMQPTRRQILENIKYNVTIELAKLTLEET